jgi:hypothetical protein
VFARKLVLTIESAGERRPVPREWLEQFFLRDFTGHSAFDETLPAGDGLLETGFRVDPGEVRLHFEKWLRGRRMIAAEAALSVETQRGNGQAT